MNRAIKIVSWNMRKSHACGVEALEDDEVDVVLGQEVPIKRRINDTNGGNAANKFWKVWPGYSSSDRTEQVLTSHHWRLQVYTCQSSGGGVKLYADWYRSGSAGRQF